MSPNSSMRALQCINTAGELGGFKENSDGISHTSLIVATSTGFTLWPSRHPMALSSPAAYPNRYPPDPPSTQDRLQCRRPDPPKILSRATQVPENLGDVCLHTVSPQVSDPLIIYKSTDCFPFTALYPARPIPASSFVLPPGPETPSTHHYPGPTPLPASHSSSGPWPLPPPAPPLSMQRTGSRPPHQPMSPLSGSARCRCLFQRQHQHIFLRHLKKSNNPPDTGGPAATLQVRVLCPMSLLDLPLSPNTVIVPPAPPIVPPLQYTFSRGCL